MQQPTCIFKHSTNLCNFSSGETTQNSAKNSFLTHLISAMKSVLDLKVAVLPAFFGCGVQQPNKHGIWF